MELKQIKHDLVIKVNECIPECRKFVEDNHYTKNYGRGGRFYFSLWYENELCGVSIWRQPNGRLTYKMFDGETDNSRILDLTRMVLREDMPKNTESYFLSRNIRYIKQKILDIHYLITYADKNQEHTGIIYRASNWRKFGIGGDSSEIYYLEDDGTETLKSSRWISHLKKRNEYEQIKDRIIKKKVKGKFRFYYPLREDKVKVDKEKVLKQFTKLENK